MVFDTRVCVRLPQRSAGYRFRYPCLRETSTKECWVSFSIPIRDSRGNGAELCSLMVIMGFTGDAPMVLYEGLLGSAGIVFDTHKAV